MKFFIYSKSAASTEDQSLPEQVPKSPEDLRQYLPEEFIDRSWLYLPEIDTSNFPV
jgi:hypothetical protein